MNMPTLHYHLKKKDGAYIAKCVEIPAVMVYAKTPKEIEDKLNKAVRSYLDAFPDEMQMIKNQQVKELAISQDLQAKG
ncbi:type II toxin-antitoxin system HicB family antitoxin [Nitrososphaera viennensis]|nr:hypothetical protein [Nitrososphaera viennensis]UVS68707.1 hypothetical protein NWT39_12475 [Nitrososphaera viennensis]